MNGKRRRASKETYECDLISSREILPNVDSCNQTESGCPAFLWRTLRMHDNEWQGSRCEWRLILCKYLLKSNLSCSGRPAWTEVSNIDLHWSMVRGFFGGRGGEEHGRDWGVTTAPSRSAVVEVARGWRVELPWAQGSTECVNVRYLRRIRSSPTFYCLRRFCIASVPGAPCQKGLLFL